MTDRPLITKLLEEALATEKRHSASLQQALEQRLTELKTALGYKKDVERLQQELRQSGEVRQQAEKRVTALTRDIADLRKHIAALRGSAKSAQGLLELLERSESYRLGHAIILIFKSPLLLLRLASRLLLARPRRVTRSIPSAAPSSVAQPSPLAAAADAAAPRLTAPAASNKSAPAGTASRAEPDRAVAEMRPARPTPFQRPPVFPVPPAAAPVAPAMLSKPRFALCVTTWNRQKYIERFIDTFEGTRSDRFAWTLIVADDGSTDSTLDYLSALRLGCRVVVIENKARTVAGQTNTLLAASQALEFDFGLKADDDIFFAAPGWDSLYYEAVQQSGFDHLVYHNAEWKPPSHHRECNGLVSSVSALDCMGCLYSFTPRLLERVGFFDVLNFPIRGHAHVDFTVRACRAGFNEADSLWDAAGSGKLVSMWQRDGYIELTDWKSPAIKQALSPAERARRIEVIKTPTRVYVPDQLAQGSHRSAISISPREREAEDSLIASHHFVVRDGTARQFDAVFVLNLRRDLRKWSLTAEMLARHGLPFERFNAVDGSVEPYHQQWTDYAARGLVLREEQEINRKLIQSAGAWGYLSTMENLLETAKSRRLRRILVFDDDVMLHRDFGPLLEAGMAELPHDWKLLYLGCTQTNWDCARPATEHLFHPSGAANGSFAVALDSSVFDLALSEIRKREWPFDAGALRAIDRAHPKQTFAFTPSLVVADVSSSAIRESRNPQRFAREARWDLGLYEDRLFSLAEQNDSASESDGLVSVLVDCESLDDSAREMLRALSHQTYGKLEILIRAPADSEALAALDTRIKLFGEASELAELFAAARGQFITMHEPAAVSAPDRIARAVALLQSDKSVDAVATPALAMNTTPVGYWSNGARLRSWTERYRAGDMQLPVGVIMRRSAAPSVNVLLDAGAIRRRDLGEGLYFVRAQSATASSIGRDASSAGGS